MSQLPDDSEWRPGSCRVLRSDGFITVIDKARDEFRWPRLQLDLTTFDTTLKCLEPPNHRGRFGAHTADVQTTSPAATTLCPRLHEASNSGRASQLQYCGVHTHGSQTSGRPIAAPWPSRTAAAETPYPCLPAHKRKSSNLGIRIRHELGKLKYFCF